MTDSNTSLESIVLDCSVAEVVIGKIGEMIDPITQSEILALVAHLASCSQCQAQYNKMMEGGEGASNKIFG